MFFADPETAAPVVVSRCRRKTRLLRIMMFRLTIPAVRRNGSIPGLRRSRVFRPPRTSGARQLYTLKRKSYTLNKKSYTLKRKFPLLTGCNLSITIDKNKQNSVPASGGHLPYISPLSVESYALPKAKLGEVIRFRSSLSPSKNISNHSVIASCRQSWVLSGPRLMRGLAEREECRKFFENKSEIWKARGVSSAVGMEVAA